MSVEGPEVEEKVLRVRSTKRVEQLYDLEVPEFECFGIGQGVIVHNSSATNAGFGARLTQYQKELKEVVPKLTQYYKGLRMRVG
jgi:hypothetical protein